MWAEYRGNNCGWDDKQLRVGVCVCVLFAFVCVVCTYMCVQNVSTCKGATKAALLLVDIHGSRDIFLIGSQM